MKHMILSLSLVFAPAVAAAWAPYEQQSFEQQMAEQQVDYGSQTSSEYDPATVPLAYIEGYESDSSSASTDGPLDAD